MAEQKLTHIVGTFLIQAEGAFLNGAGLDDSGEDRNAVIPKTFQDGRYRVPYVSSQAWRRWLRETFKEEYPNEPKAELKALSKNARGNPDKIGTEMDPVMFPEDDIFGYMRAEKGQGRAKAEDEDEDATIAEAEAEEAAPKGKQKGSKTRAVMRPSPFSSSILKSIRTTGWQGDDEGFVHLKEGSPLPYKTRFYNTQLQGIFGLGYDRLGTFRNEGDRIELDEALVSKYLKEEVIEKDADREIYRVKNNRRRERATMILRSLAVLRGGAKQAQFGTDVTPKVIILAGLNCGNLIFNDLFEEKDLQPVLKLATLQQIIADYQNRLMTPVFIGLRDGYLHPENEREVKEWAKNNTQVRLLSPVKAVEKLTDSLKDLA
ncbi:MAG TPA: DevR family CRISPR-associated autoregulator [Blastocatellia bacterium]|nr:DevR family CRISPR-associated autoregulator [Blastocatellia bacterium]